MIMTISIWSEKYLQETNLIAASEEACREEHQPNRVRRDAYQVAFCMKYNHKAFAIERVLEKHLGILEQDPLLLGTISAKPRVIYHKPRNLKNLIAPSIVKSHKKREQGEQREQGNY